MQIYIFQTEEGSPIPLDVNIKDSILSVKQKISEWTAIPVEQQRLLFEHNVLEEDDATLEAYGIDADHNSLELSLAVSSDNAQNYMKKSAKNKTNQKSPFGSIYDTLKNARFCCGGILDNVSTTVFFSNDQGSHHITFPNYSKEEIEALRSASKPATFGKGQKTVLDPEYRNALALFPPHFALSFHPHDHDILTQIQQLMVPESGTLKAELYQLNLYGEGSHFKSHVDTPRGADMIGSLVVSLPSFHEGGQLVIRKGKTEHTFDFGKGDPKATKIQWAAFFADCEHEILPVTKGYRITITYLLKSVGKSNLATSVRVSYPQLLQSLYQKMEDTSFHPQGKILVFSCFHSYANDALAAAEKDPSKALKGSDAMLYGALKSVGLDTKLKACIELEDPETGALTHWIPNRIPASVQTGSIYEEDNEADFVKETFPGKFLDKNSEWCNDVKGTQFLAACTGSYGNDISCDSLYFEAVLLVTLPHASNLIRQWRKIKLLWLGQSKNTPQDCPFARLPKEIVKRIIEYTIAPNEPKQVAKKAAKPEKRKRNQKF